MMSTLFGYLLLVLRFTCCSASIVVAIHWVSGPVLNLHLMNDLNWSTRANRRQKSEWTEGNNSFFFRSLFLSHSLICVLIHSIRNKCLNRHQVIPHKSCNRKKWMRTYTEQSQRGKNMYTMKYCTLMRILRVQTIAFVVLSQILNYK